MMSRIGLRAGREPTAKIALLAESSQAIGTGHLIEAITLAALADDHGLAPILWSTAAAPAGLVVGIPFPVRLATDFGLACLRGIARELAGAGVAMALTNLRSVENEQVAVLRDAGLRVVCLDEWGQRRLDCDAVVNPSPVARFHAYTSGNPAFQLYTGLDYFPLDPGYAILHDRGRRHDGPVRSVVVSMGGVDRSGATVRLVRAVLEVRPEMTVHVVIGPGFSHRRELDVALASRQSSRVVLHEQPPSLAELLIQCDVGITAGGNTLAELACVGTPALVAFEDPHERDQGQAFEQLGFGCCLDRGVDVTASDIQEVLAGYDDPDVRQRHCDAGKRLVDGRGAGRIIAIAFSRVRCDSTVSTGSSAERFHLPR